MPFPAIETLERRTLLALPESIPGSLDSTFANGGILDTQLHDPVSNALISESSTTIDRSGRLVVAGESGTTTLAIARFTADGSRVSSFGSNGIVTFDASLAAIAGRGLGASGVDAARVIVQQNRSVLLVGTVFYDPRGDSRDILIVQFDDAGMLLRFRVYQLPYELQSRGFTVAETRDGLLVIGGGAENGQPVMLCTDSRLRRVTSFQNNGLLFAPPSGKTIDLAIDRSDNIVLLTSGAVSQSGTFAPAMLRRFDRTGALDTQFGAGGDHASVEVSGTGPRVAFVAVDHDNRIVVAGSIGQAQIGPSEATLWRFDEDGIADPQFGIGGISNVGLTSANVRELVTGISMTDDGRTLVAAYFGAGINDVTNQCAIARFDGAGALDVDFVNHGLNTIDFDADQQAFTNQVTIAPDGSATMGVSTFDNDQNPQKHVAAVRVRAEAVLLRSRTLYVRGTDRADSILLRSAGGKIRVTIAGEPAGDFDPTSISAISVQAARGDDIVRIQLNRRSTLFGGAGNDQLIGGDAADVLFGEKGNDSLFGGNADDLRLDGGPGADLLDGGEGFDRYVFDPLDQQLNCEKTV